MHPIIHMSNVNQKAKIYLHVCYSKECQKVKHLYYPRPSYKKRSWQLNVSKVRNCPQHSEVPQKNIYDLAVNVPKVLSRKTIERIFRHFRHKLSYRIEKGNKLLTDDLLYQKLNQRTSSTKHRYFHFSLSRPRIRQDDCIRQVNNSISPPWRQNEKVQNLISFRPKLFRTAQGHYPGSQTKSHIDNTTDKKREIHLNNKSMPKSRCNEYRSLPHFFSLPFSLKPRLSREGKKTTR